MEGIISGVERLRVKDFRSIRGSIELEFGSRFTLIYGANGFGKTSVLSALELALTGEVRRLKDVDPGYKRNLVNVGAPAAHVRLALSDADADVHVEVKEGVSRGRSALSGELARTYADRCYLEQSSLARLLERYQSRPSEASSAMAAFADEVLGIERLAALAQGLEPVRDLRNFRKAVPAYRSLEDLRERAEEDLARQELVLGECDREVERLRSECLKSMEAAGVPTVPGEELMDSIARVTGHLSQAVAMKAAAETLVGRLDELLRNIGAGSAEDARPIPEVEEDVVAARERVMLAREEYWSCANSLVEQGREQDLGFEGAAAEALRRSRASFAEVAEALDAFARGRAFVRELNEQIAQLQLDVESAVEARSLGDGNNSLRQALALLLPMMEGNLCPVCERDFSEVDSERDSLIQHASQRIDGLVEAASRIETLQREVSAREATLSRMIAERDSMLARISDSRYESELRSRQERFAEQISRLELAQELGARADAASAISDDLRRQLEALRDQEGRFARLHELIRDSQRFLNEADTSYPHASAWAGEFYVNRMRQLVASLQSTVRLREEVGELGMRARANAERARLAADAAASAGARLDDARHDLAIMDSRRKDLVSLSAAAESLQTSVLDQVIDGNLNGLWRDLFGRLAPSEPFHPRLRLASGKRQSVSLVFDAVHASGRVYGTPDEILSAGNLNTAALTLFLGLNLALEPPLPWLVLDDPVQSMDDLHISHFAALLRTLGRTHRRQVIVAVHDEALFDYLCLELAPAATHESLGMIRLGRGRDGLTRADVALDHWKRDPAQIA